MVLHKLGRTFTKNAYFETKLVDMYWSISVWSFLVFRGSYHFIPAIGVVVFGLQFEGR